MAGSEKSGYSNAKAMLIENAYYVLTPTSKVPQEKIDNYVNFVRDLRAIPIILDYQEHDQVTGTISQMCIRDRAIVARAGIAIKRIKLIR